MRVWALWVIRSVHQGDTFRYARLENVPTVFYFIFSYVAFTSYCSPPHQIVCSSHTFWRNLQAVFEPPKQEHFLFHHSCLLGLQPKWCKEPIIKQGGFLVLSRSDGHSQSLSSWSVQIHLPCFVISLQEVSASVVCRRDCSDTNDCQSHVTGMLTISHL